MTAKASNMQAVKLNNSAYKLQPQVSALASTKTISLVTRKILKRKSRQKTAVNKENFVLQEKIDSMSRVIVNAFTSSLTLEVPKQLLLEIIGN